MSRKGDCLDKAPVENFFHMLKTERVHRRIYITRADPQRDLFQYIGLLPLPPPALGPGLSKPNSCRASRGLAPSTFPEKLNAATADSPLSLVPSAPLAPLVSTVLAALEPTRALTV